MPPLFRKIDWLALLIAFGVIWIVYFLTLAPEQTLEDSGELCTGSFYAGIPHPPGYPFWAIYSWLWTKLLPMGNVAWRVEVGEATAAALACGLVALMVSRGSSMLMEGIEELRDITGKWEGAICLVSGTVAGLLLGLGGVMWSESVAINRISLFGVPWVMIVLVCLLRWIYAPHQRRYLYMAMFFFGICATIHQTLLVAAMGIEAAIIATQPRLGRDVLLGNSVIYVALLYAYYPSNGAFAARGPRQSHRRRLVSCHWRRFHHRLHHFDDSNQKTPDRMVAVHRHARVVCPGRLVLLLRTDRRHDGPAHAMGLSAHGRGILSRHKPRPVRKSQSVGRLSRILDVSSCRWAF